MLCWIFVQCLVIFSLIIVFLCYHIKLTVPAFCQDQIYEKQMYRYFACLAHPEKTHVKLLTAGLHVVVQLLTQYCFAQFHVLLFCSWMLISHFLITWSLRIMNFALWLRSRGITPKRVTSGGAHFRGLAPGQHSFKETLQRWRAFGDTVSGFTGSEIAFRNFISDGSVLSNWLKFVV